MGSLRDVFDPQMFEVDLSRLDGEDKLENSLSAADELLSKEQVILEGRPAL